MSKTRSKTEGYMILAVTEPGARKALKLLKVLKADLCHEVDEAERYLSGSAAGRLLVICPRSEIGVGRLLAEDVPPLEAVRRWSSEAIAVLDLLRRHRQRITLIFEDLVAQHWKECIAVLGYSSSASIDFENDVEDPLMGTIARKAIKGAHAASALSSELEAYAFVPEGGVYQASADPTATFIQYQQMRHSIAQAREETSLLKEHLSLAAASHDENLSAKNEEISRLNKLLLEKSGAYEAAQKECVKLKDVIAKRESEAEKLQHASQAAASAVTEAEQRAAATHKELAESKGYIELLRRQLSLDLQQSEKLTEAKGYIELLRQQMSLDLQQSEAQRLNFTKLLAEGQKNAATLQADLQKSVAKAKELEGQLSKAKAEVEKLKLREVELQKSVAKAKDLEGQLSKATAEVEKLKLREADLQKSVAKAKELEGQLSKATAEVEKLKLREADLQKSVAKAKELEGQLGKAKAEVEKLKLREAELLKEHHSFEQERGLLHEQIRLEIQLHDVQRAEIEKVQRELLEVSDKLRSETAGLQNEAEVAMRQLLDRLKEAGEKIADYHAQVQALHLERSELQGKLRRLLNTQDDMAAYVESSNVLSVQMEQLQAAIGHKDQSYQAELAAAHQYSAALRDELASIHRSISYRSAAPLRGIRRVFKPQGK